MDESSQPGTLHIVCASLSRETHFNEHHMHKQNLNAAMSTMFDLIDHNTWHNTKPNVNPFQRRWCRFSMTMSKHFQLKDTI